MSMFKDMLRGDESLFRNEMALDFEFLPKLLPYRENEQRHFATCIAPLLQSRNGRNLFVYGAPGIGKTAAMKFVFRDLEEETDDVVPIYVNCWQKNTTFKVLVEICDQLGYKLTHNKRTEELFEVVKNIVNKKSAVFAFDEIDKVEDYDFLYTILEEIFKKSVFLITNHKDWLVELDQRVKSRLLPEVLEFRKYNIAEMKGILKQRIDYAFAPGVWDDAAVDAVAAKTFELEDIRSGLYLLRESGLAAEAKSSKKVTIDHVKEAVAKMDEFSIKPKSDLDDDMQKMLDIVKENSGSKIGDLFKLYQQQGGQSVYKTFQRKIRKLADGKFISIQLIKGGAEGTTSIIKYQSTKKLTEF
ncbi:AAA family ATPase [Candidatus Woesearchaeota archaeon]|nr:AAA family ATPase [Candidatus Woesearchaeota archaeon]